MKNIKIATAFAAAMGFMVVLVTLLGINTVIQLDKASDSESLLYLEDTRPIGYTTHLVLPFYSAWLAMSNANMATDKAALTRWFAKVDANRKAVDEALDALGSSIRSAQGREAVAEVRRRVGVVMNGLEAAKSKLEAGKDDEIIASMVAGELNKAREDVEPALTRLVGVIEQGAASRATENATSIRRTTWYSVILMASAAMAAVMLSLSLFRRTNRAIRGLLAETEKLVASATAGELSARASTEGIDGEFRPILNGLNRTLDALVRPLNVAASYIDRIANGEILSPPKSRGTTFTEITGTQEPTRWRGGRASRGPTAR